MKKYPKYPYFIYQDVMALRNGVSDEEEVGKIRRRIAANIGDIPSLRIALGIDPEEFAAFYPDMKPETPSTFDAIDGFLNNFTRQPHTSQDVAGLEDINITSTGNIAPATVKNKNLRRESQGAGNSIEQAMDLVRKHKYEEALEIIISLNLNNPKKSAYFADQIRFLKKLVINEANKKLAKQQASKAKKY